MSVETRCTRDCLDAVQGCLKRGSFRLSSGKQSDILFDLELVTWGAKGRDLAGRMSAALENPKGLVAVEWGGVPLAVHMAAILNLPVTILLKNGGLRGEKTIAGWTVVDDVATTGRSIAFAQRVYDCADAVVVLKRAEFGRLSFPVRSLFIADEEGRVSYA